MCQYDVPLCGCAVHHSWMAWGLVGWWSFVIVAWLARPPQVWNTFSPPSPWLHYSYINRNISCALSYILHLFVHIYVGPLCTCTCIIICTYVCYVRPEGMCTSVWWLVHCVYMQSFCFRGIFSLLWTLLKSLGWCSARAWMEGILQKEWCWWSLTFMSHVARIVERPHWISSLMAAKNANTGGIIVVVYSLVDWRNLKVD